MDPNPAHSPHPFGRTIVNRTAPASLSWDAIYRIKLPQIRHFLKCASLKMRRRWRIRNAPDVQSCAMLQRQSKSTISDIRRPKYHNLNPTSMISTQNHPNATATRAVVIGTLFALKSKTTGEAIKSQRTRLNDSRYRTVIAPPRTCNSIRPLVIGVRRLYPDEKSASGPRNSTRSP